LRAHRRSGIAVASAIGACVVAGCTYDFTVFNPSLDASTDASDAAPDGGDTAPPDAGPDAIEVDGGDAGDGAPACTAPVGCLTETASCSTKCAQDEIACEAAIGCDLNPSCVPNCKTTETSCKKGCIATCTVCTADGGCLDTNACTTAAK
jgi:hypothetical protein